MVFLGATRSRSTRLWHAESIGLPGKVKAFPARRTDGLAPPPPPPLQPWTRMWRLQNGFWSFQCETTARRKARTLRMAEEKMWKNLGPRQHHWTDGLMPVTTGAGVSCYLIKINSELFKLLLVRFSAMFMASPSLRPHHTWRHPENRPSVWTGGHRESASAFGSSPNRLWGINNSSPHWRHNPLYSMWTRSSYLPIKNSCSWPWLWNQRLFYLSDCSVSHTPMEEGVSFSFLHVLTLNGKR